MGLLEKLIKFVYPYDEEYSVKHHDREITLVKNTRADYREVTFNRFIYSRIMGKTLFTHSYWDFFIPAAYIYDDPRILMIGLGGGTVPYQLDRLLGNKVNMDVSEIDKDMVDIARKFYPGLRANISVSDGSEFVMGKKNEYDAIFLDAYKDLDIPEQFMKEEFVFDAHRALKHDGILCINFAQTVVKAGQLHSYAKKLSEFFKVYFINVSIMADNTIIVCSKSLDKERIIRSIRANMPRMKDNDHLFSAYERMSQFR